MNGGRLGVLVVFFGHGPKIAGLSEALAGIPKDKAGWFLGSPGVLMDRIQGLVAPGSVTNTRCQALDKLLEHRRK
jgi:hypothetical protein